MDLQDLSKTKSDCLCGQGRERGWGWLLQDLYLGAWLDDDVIVINWGWRASEFNLVHIQPVLDPLNDTSLLVLYNNCKHYQNALSSHLLFLCHPKGLAGDFVYFIEVKAPWTWPLGYDLLIVTLLKNGNQTSLHGHSGNLGLGCDGPIHDLF